MHILTAPLHKRTFSFFFTHFYLVYAVSKTGLFYKPEIKEYLIYYFMKYIQNTDNWFFTIMHKSWI